MPTSRATRVTSPANADSVSTIPLMVSASVATSPLASTEIFWLRSPRATAVVTWAMLRTWLVRLPAMPLTESVRSFQVPATAGTWAWPPSLPSMPTSRATRVTSEVNTDSCSFIPLKTAAISFISGSWPSGSRVLKSPPRTALSPASSCCICSCCLACVAVAMPSSPSTVRRFARRGFNDAIFSCWTGQR